MKIQRELEQLKGELQESQTKISTLKEKLSNIEAEKDQSNLTGTGFVQGFNLYNLLAL